MFFCHHKKVFFIWNSTLSRKVEKREKNPKLNNKSYVKKFIQIKCWNNKQKHSPKCLINKTRIPNVSLSYFFPSSPSNHIRNNKINFFFSVALFSQYRSIHTPIIENCMGKKSFKALFCCWLSARFSPWTKLY